MYPFQVDQRRSLVYPPFRPKSMQWGSTALRFKYDVNEGHITLPSGTKVFSCRVIKSSIVLELFDQNTNAVIQKPANFYKQFKLDPTYNCMGYCLDNSRSWILDPTAILAEEYEEVEYEDCEIMIFKEFIGFGDNGETTEQISHMVKLLRNGNVSFKPGLNALVENVHDDQAIHTYNYNREQYYRLKGQ
jgi:hypothetical protein